PAFAVLEATTSVKDGLATVSAGAALARIPKVQATGDLATLKDALEKLRSPAFEEACVAAASSAAELAKDADSLDGVSREALLRSALDLYDDKACPVCDTPFVPDTFRQHVAGKLKYLEDVTAKRKALE